MIASLKNHNFIWFLPRSSTASSRAPTPSTRTPARPRTSAPRSPLAPKSPRTHPVLIPGQWTPNSWIYFLPVPLRIFTWGSLGAFLSWSFWPSLRLFNRTTSGSGSQDLIGSTLSSTTSSNWSPNSGHTSSFLAGRSESRMLPWAQWIAIGCHLLNQDELSSTTPNTCVSPPQKWRLHW